LVTITSSDEDSFNNCKLFCYKLCWCFVAIIGSNVVRHNGLLDTDIVCKFGRFGSTAGALLAYNQIGCPSPNTVIPPQNVSEETVEIEVALNGQDFLQISIPFQFIGTKSKTSGSEAGWVMNIAIGGIMVIFVLYVLTRYYNPKPDGEKIPLTKNIQKSDEFINKSAPQRNFFV